MRFTLDVGRQARRDLVAIHRWIRDADDDRTADDYLRRIGAAIESLRSFPHRGTPRIDVGDGLRTITVERRLIVVYRVDGERVSIRRVLDGRRDWPRLLG